MLRAKSEVLTIIIRFIDLIFNQFDKRLRIFRSDNAKEYFNCEVNSYMERAKSEVPTIIIWFIDLIFNQFDKRLRIFRSDNGKEYFNNEVNSYMENHGIIHESS